MSRINAHDIAEAQSIPAMNDKLECHEQARKTITQSAFGLAATKGDQPRRPSSSGPSKNSQRSAPECGRGEQDRRLTLRGKCFCCARNDHMLPQYSYPTSVKCNICANVGHIYFSFVCGKRQNVSMAQQTTLLPAPQQQLAIGYDGGSNSSATRFPADGATSAWGAQSTSSRPIGLLQRCLCD